MAKSKQLKGKPAAFLMFALGSVFALIGAGFTYFSYDFSQHSRATTGTVVDVIVRYPSASNSSRAPTYKPVVSYLDNANVQQEGTTNLSSSAYNYAIGSGVDIRYDTRDPQNLRIDNWFALWGFGLIFFAVGLATDIAAVFVFRAAAKKEAHAGKNSADGGGAADASPASARSYSYKAPAPEDEKPGPSTVRRR